MIKQIIKCLQNIKEISDWKLTITEAKTTEMFYVLEQLETTRATDTTDYEVTVYKEIEKDNKKYLGSSTITIPHKMTDEKLMELLNDALYAASLVTNEYYEIVKGDRVLTFNEDSLLDKPLESLDKIATIFFDVSSEFQKFNSLELFYNIQIIRIINSQGVDYTKTLHSIEIEAIPSYDGEKQKVEIYKYFRYQKIDPEQIKTDAIDALNEVESRYYAENLKEKKKIDVILRDEHIFNLVRELISTSSYQSIYNETAIYKLNDEVQKNPSGDPLTVTLMPISKNDGFDQDGVLLNPVRILEKGKLINYFGNNRYAYYLGVKPTGNLRLTKVELGTNSIEEMKKMPYIEILSLSGLQVDIYSGYIGGEVRLANYYDGNTITPLSGFSFSGNLADILHDITLSKEAYTSIYYIGPKYLKLKNLEVL